MRHFPCTPQCNLPEGFCVIRKAISYYVKNYNVIAGTFPVVGLSDDDFTSLSYNLAQKYTEHFKYPEMLGLLNGEITSIPLYDEEIIKSVHKQEASLTYYVAECMEFVNLGEYHNNLTLQEAIKLYNAIPPERSSSGKGIGFSLHDGSMYDDMEYGLVEGNLLYLDTICLIQHYKESPLVRAAVEGIIKALPNLEVIDHENYLKNTEIATEDDYGMIDGIINNGKKEIAPSGANEKFSLREKLAGAKHEVANQKVSPSEKPDKSHLEPEL